MHLSSHIYIRSIVLLCSTLFSLVHAQEQNTTPYYASNSLRISKVEYSIDWVSSTVVSDIYFRWETSSSQYLNPSKAYKIAQLEIPNILARLTKEITLYDDDSLLDFVRERNAYRGVLSILVDSSIITAQIPSKDLLGTTIIYNTSLVNVVRNYIMPAFNPQTIPVLSFANMNNDVYTSILIDLRNKLPPLSDVASDDLTMYSPKLFPKLYSEYQRTLVFTPEYVTAELSDSQMPFHYMYPEDYTALPLGSNPLLILPIAIDSEENGDAIISFEDTRLLLSSEKNKQLIRQGKIYFIIVSQSPMELH